MLIFSLLLIIIRAPWRHAAADTLTLMPLRLIRLMLRALPLAAVAASVYATPMLMLVGAAA